MQLIVFALALILEHYWPLTMIFQNTWGMLSFIVETKAYLAKMSSDAYGLIKMR